MNTIIESMQAIVPQGDYRIDEIKEYLTLIFKITEGIKKDKIACIVPTKDDINLIKKIKILYFLILRLLVEEVQH